MPSINELLEYNIDPVPKYRLLRDIVKLPEDEPQLVTAKEEVLRTKWVIDLISLQQPNGSWGYFHSLSTKSDYTITTEQALRRLRILGLDYRDKCIQKAVGYMKRYLLGEEDFPDRKEKLHDWTIATHLMIAAQIRLFLPEDKLAVNIAHKWKDIIEYAFSGSEYSQKLYEEAYEETFHKKPRGGRLVDFTNFYPLTLLSGLLSGDAESKVLDYVISRPEGIYYIYDKCLGVLPEDFASKQASRYLAAVELLSGYSAAKEKFSYVVKWLQENCGEDGFWDMGASTKDGIQYPLSASWKKDINRKIDCTVRVASLLVKLGQTFDKFFDEK
jgi:hypothetical protein